MSPLLSKRICLVGGPGGVGKTTLSASLAVQYARQGYRTLVMTIDPAKRLAQALGFSQFHSELQEVQIPGASYPLIASMLDSQRYFDRLVERHSKSEEQKKKILANPLYQLVVEHLGGTHEYAAMERLLEFSEDPKWERIVIDTPPTSNAVDLLRAPKRISDFMDNSVFRWFQGRTKRFGFFKQGGKIVFKLLSTVLGTDFLEELGDLLLDIEGMQSGFQNRNEEVMSRLSQPSTGFILVTNPHPARLRECVEFQTTLSRYQIELAMVILNRVEPVYPRDTEVPKGCEEMFRFYRDLSAEDQRYVHDFLSAFSPIPVEVIERRSRPPYDIESLSELTSGWIR